MAILTVGIDTAKNVFAVHGVDAAGSVQLRQPKVPRAKLTALVASLPPCTIGMQACTGAHYWARRFQAHGHTVRLMASKLVMPYRMSGKRGKNDAADAAAVCEAVGRSNMRFVPAKTEDQQSRLMVHRARQGFVTARTATINRIRSLLAEFGVVLPQKPEVVRRQAAAQLEGLPGYANLVIGDLLSEVHHLDERIAQYDRHIHAMARQCTVAQRLMQLPPIPPPFLPAGRGRVALCRQACRPPNARPASPPAGCVLWRRDSAALNSTSLLPPRDDAR
jgi:transposase